MLFSEVSLSVFEVIHREMERIGFRQFERLFAVSSACICELGNKN